MPRQTRRAWIVLVACLVCQMGLGLGGYIFAVFLKSIVADMGWTRAAFSLSGAPFLLAMALASPLVGTATERLGARVVFSLAIVLVATTLVLFSHMQNIWQFYALGFLLGGATTGLGDIPAGTVVAQWFGQGRGLALGLVYIGSNIGGTIVPIAAQAIAEVSSWRTALRVLAIAGCAVILPFALFVVRERREAVVDGAPAPAAPPLPGMTLAEARRTPSFWVLFGVLTTFYFYYLGVNHHLVAFLSDGGFSDAAAARSFSAAVAVGIAGKVGMGLLADRIPIRLAIVINFALLALASFLLLGVRQAPALLPAFLAIHGFTVAAENVMLPLVVAECFGVEHMARIYGAIMLALLPGGVAGSVFAGWVFDTVGTYFPAFAAFAALNTCAVVALTWLRPLGRAVRLEASAG